MATYAWTAPRRTPRAEPALAARWRDAGLAGRRLQRWALCVLTGCALLLGAVLFSLLLPSRRESRAESLSAVRPADPPRISAAPPAPPRPPTVEEVVARTERSIAFIQGRLGTGTGFLMRPGVVATNRHVIENEVVGNLQIHFPSAPEGEKGPWPATLLSKDEDRDLALLKVEAPLPPLSMVGTYAFRRGQEVLVIGNPGMLGDVVLKNAVSRGLMSTETALGGKPFYQLSISVNRGNSGGPVLDMNGNVLGVVTLKAKETEGMAFCIPVADLQREIARLDALPAAEVASAGSRHRAQAVFRYVAEVGAAQRTGMLVYTKAMEAALRESRPVGIGLAAVREEVLEKVNRISRDLFREAARELPNVAADPLIAEAARRQLAELWANALDFKSYVDDPRGTLDSYRAKYAELVEKQERLCGSLAPLLGISRPRE